MTQFALTDDQIAIRDMARDFAAEKLAPHAVAWDEAEALSRRRDARGGRRSAWAAIYVREDVGGSGLTRLDAALIFEALATGCPTIAAYISIHNMAAWMIDRYGIGRAAPRACCRSSCTMEHLASYCLTEPGAGSDAAALEDAARCATATTMSLNGVKQFISGAGVSDVYVMMVRTGEAGAVGHLDARRREGHARPVLRRQREEDGLERAADARR